MLVSSEDAHPHIIVLAPHLLLTYDSEGAAASSHGASNAEPLVTGEGCTAFGSSSLLVQVCFWFRLVTVRGLHSFGWCLETAGDTHVQCSNHSSGVPTSSPTFAWRISSADVSSSCARGSLGRNRRGKAVRIAPPLGSGWPLPTERGGMTEGHTENIEKGIVLRALQCRNGNGLAGGGLLHNVVVGVL